MSQHYVSMTARPDTNDRTREILHHILDIFMDQLELAGETLDVTDISLSTEWDIDYLVRRWILAGGGIPSE